MARYFKIYPLLLTLVLMPTVAIGRTGASSTFRNQSVAKIPHCGGKMQVYDTIGQSLKIRSNNEPAFYLNVISVSNLLDTTSQKIIGNFYIDQFGQESVVLNSASSLRSQHFYGLKTPVTGEFLSPPLRITKGLFKTNELSPCS